MPKAIRPRGRRYTQAQAPAPHQNSSAPCMPKAGRSKKCESGKPNKTPMASQANKRPKRAEDSPPSSRCTLGTQAPKGRRAGPSKRSARQSEGCPSLPRNSVGKRNKVELDATQSNAKRASPRRERGRSRGRSAAPTANAIIDETTVLPRVACTPPNHSTPRRTPNHSSVPIQAVTTANNSPACRRVRAAGAEVALVLSRSGPLDREVRESQSPRHAAVAAVAPATPAAPSRPQCAERSSAMKIAPLAAPIKLAPNSHPRSSRFPSGQ